ncbi:DUF2130 domain-containing protein [Dehalogenimonas etheniformans]|nr:DUF2130 domain-containing protein [Dehalogenimonas etheniformans]QNT76676.1 DUF2130 domain-containing protein [Dehalogenimonas etheniformans]
MSSNIMLSSEETILCPKCGGTFQIKDGISRHSIDLHEKEYQKILEERSKGMREELAKEASKEAEKLFKAQVSELSSEIEEKDLALKNFEKKIKKLKIEAEERATKEFDEERKELQEELKKQEDSIKNFREQESALRKEKKQLEEDKRNFEIDQERKLEAAKKDIEKRVCDIESERFRLKEADYKKKIEDAAQANTELTRKLEQGSQQLQGEVLELEIESLLRQSFPSDLIKEIAKGVRGADISQQVCSQSGIPCGTIIWEAKRSQNWSDKWLQKVKDDCLASNGDVAVIVSTIMPKDCDGFKIIDGVWVISDKIVRPVAETLRVMLIQLNSLKAQNDGRARKADLIYSYLGTPQFLQNLRSVFEGFEQMKLDLDREKNAMYRTWKKREMQLERVAVGMSSIVGQIQGIAQDSLPELDNIEHLQLPSEQDEI